MKLDYSKIDAIVTELEEMSCPIFLTRKYVANCLGRDRLHDATEDVLEAYLLKEHNVTLASYHLEGFYFIKRELIIGSDSDLSKHRTYREEQNLDYQNEREGLVFLASLKEENVVPPSITWESCQESLNDNLEYIKAILAYGSVPSNDISSMLDEYELDIDRINSFVCYLFEDDEFELDEDEFKDDYREFVRTTKSMAESFCETVHEIMDPEFEYDCVRAPSEPALEIIFKDVLSVLDSYRDIVFNVIDYKVQHDLESA